MVKLVLLVELEVLGALILPKWVDNLELVLLRATLLMKMWLM
jgi:hypothetical protein